MKANHYLFFLGGLKWNKKKTRARSNTPDSSFLPPAPSFLLLSFLSPWSESELMGESSVAESPYSVSIHSHQITGTRREERREERRSWDRLGLSQRAVSQSVGWSVGTEGAQKRNPAESFLRRMLSSPPGPAGMHCRCGCYPKCRVIWWEIIRNGGEARVTTSMWRHTGTHKTQMRPDLSAFFCFKGRFFDDFLFYFTLAA